MFHARKLPTQHRIAQPKAKLQGENRRLKKLVAEQALDIDMLKEISRGNF